MQERYRKVNCVRGVWEQANIRLAALASAHDLTHEGIARPQLGITHVKAQKLPLTLRGWPLHGFCVHDVIAGEVLPQRGSGERFKP